MPPPDANGTKKVRRVPLEAATTASASDELHRMIISRDDNHQPAMVENSDKVNLQNTNGYNYIQK